MTALPAYVQESYPNHDITKEVGAKPSAASDRAPTSAKALWAGRILSGLAALFLLFDAIMKVIAPPAAVEGTVALGYPENILLALGIIQIVCLAAYLIPRTAVIGAVLWTGYLGGAVATHVRVENPLFSHTLFPVYVAALLWMGLWLRDPQLRKLLPVRTDA